MNQPERNEKIELYGRGYDLLMEALKDIPREIWTFKPAPREWSVHEVLVHLADSETNAALRARKLIVEPGGMLMGYDQDKWATELDYHDQSYEDAMFQGMQKGGQDTRTTGAQRMSQGDRPAIHIHFIPVPTLVGEGIAICKDLCCERLVELDQVNILQGPIDFFQQLWNGIRGSSK